MVLRLAGEQVESLFGEPLPVAVREVPEDLVRLDELVQGRALLIERGGNAPLATTAARRSRWPSSCAGWSSSGAAVGAMRRVSARSRTRCTCAACVAFDGLIGARRVDGEKAHWRLGPKVVAELTPVVIAKAKRESRCRVRGDCAGDSTVVEADFRWLSDVGLSLDGVRALARRVGGWQRWPARAPGHPGSLPDGGQAAAPDRAHARPRHGQEAHRGPAAHWRGARAAVTLDPRATSRARSRRRRASGARGLGAEAKLAVQARRAGRPPRRGSPARSISAGPARDRRSPGPSPPRPSGCSRPRAPPQTRRGKLGVPAPVQKFAGPLVDGLEAGLLGVDCEGLLEILGRQTRRHLGVLQHQVLQHVLQRMPLRSRNERSASSGFLYGLEGKHFVV
jgi:hypothetical protein